jgi:hypothetical protein
MAMIGAAFGIGFTFGPLLGFASLFLPLAGAPGYMASTLSLIALLYGWSKMPETRTGQTPISEHLRRRIIDMGATLRVLKMPQVGLLVATFFLATFAFGSLETTLSFVNRLLLTGEELTREQRAALLTREAATTTIEKLNFLIFAYVGLVLMLIQGFIYRRMVQRVGEVRFLRMGIALMAAGLIGAVAVLLWRPSFEATLATDGELTSWARWPLVLVGLGVMTFAVIGFALLTPSAQALISKRGDPNRQGEVLGVNQSASAMARILGPFLGMSMFDIWSSHTLPYAVGAVLLGFVLILSLGIRQD